MSVRHFLYAESIAERSTPRYEVDLETEDGVPVPATDVTSVKVTLRDLTSNTIMNGRSNQDAKNQNGGTVIDGQFALQLAEADTAIVGVGNVERRLLTIDAHLSGGRSTHEVYFYVRNFMDVT